MDINVLLNAPTNKFRFTYNIYFTLYIPAYLIAASIAKVIFLFNLLILENRMVTRRGNQAYLFMFAAMVALLSHNLVIPVMASAAIFGDSKNFFFFPPPDPHAGGSPQIGNFPPIAGIPPTGTSPPTGLTPNPPPQGSGGSNHGSTPSHDSRGGHGSTPSHGGTPPVDCGNSPSGGHHDPSPSPPKGSGGRGHHSTPPSTPCTPCTPSTPSTPTPSTPSTPSTPTPSTPNTPGTPSRPNTPSMPGTPSTPAIIRAPTTPGIILPSPPFDPNSPFPGTCDFWRTHPGIIWGLFGWWGTVGNMFGATSLPFGTNMNLLEALSVSRSDALGALYREGTASLLNSMVDKRFPYSTAQVRKSFIASLGSNKVAARQARVFKLANEGRTKPRA